MFPHSLRMFSYCNFSKLCSPVPKNWLIFSCSLWYFANVPLFPKTPGRPSTHKPAIELEDLEKLKNSEILSLTHPLSLSRNVWFHISLFWCRLEGQRSLKKSSFVFSEDTKGDHFVSMAHAKPQKTTKAMFLMLKVSRKTQECTKPAVKPMVILLSIFFCRNWIQKAKHCSSFLEETGSHLTTFSMKIGHSE